MPVQGITAFKPEKRFFCMHLGESKSGKSTAGASYPGPYLELDADLRFGGIAGSVAQGLIDGKDIKYVQFSPFGGWEPIDKELSQLEVYRIQAGNNVLPYPYGTIGVGSITSFSRCMLNLARKELKGRKVGNLRLHAPGDSNVETSGIHQVLDTLKLQPCNVIVTGHIVDRWGKDPNLEDDEASAYSPRVPIGKRLNLNDKLSSSVVSVFDNVFIFDKTIAGGKDKFWVEFSSELAGNSFGIPPGLHDITGKKFYPYLLEQIQKHRKEQTA